MKYLNYLNHAKKIVIKHDAMPEFVTFFVTDKCNFKCSYCFFHDNLNKNTNELNLEEIEKISKGMDEFIILDITGGEPFIRDDISDIVKIFYENNKIMNVVIVTNGWFSEKIKKHVAQIVKQCPKLHVLLNVSIDGIGKDFDRIREKDHAYEHCTETFKQLNPLREEYENFQMGIVITYSTLTQDSIIDTYYELKRKFRPDSVKVPLVRGAPKDAKVKNVKLDNYIKLSKIIEKDITHGDVKSFSKFPLRNFVKAANIMTYEENIKVAKTNEWVTPCYAGILNVIFRSDGDVRTCELLESSIGTFRENDYNFKKIWRNSKAVAFRKFVKDTKCFCTHECNAYTNILFNLKYYPRIFKHMGKFSKSNESMAVPIEN